MTKTHCPSTNELDLIQTCKRLNRMQSSLSSSSSLVDPLSDLISYVDTLSDQSIELKDIKWALDLPCSPPVLNFLAELIASEDSGMPERTAGLDKEERDIWDKAVQAGLVNAEPSEEAALDLSETYLTPAQLRELTTYNEQIILMKDQQLGHVLSRARTLQEIHNRISTEINQSRETCARLGAKIRDVEAYLLQFLVKMTHVYIPRLIAQLSLSLNPTPLHDKVNHLLDTLSSNFPALETPPPFQFASPNLSPKSIEEEALRLSDSLSPLLQQEYLSKDSLDKRKEKMWEREMEDVLRRMDEGDFGSEDEDEDEDGDDWEVKGQEPRQEGRYPINLVKDLIEGAWEWDMMNEVESWIERARNAKTILTKTQLPVLLLLQTTLQVKCEQTLNSLAVWQAIHVEMDSLSGQRTAFNPNKTMSIAQKDSKSEEGYEWRESIRTTLRSHLTTSTPFSANNTVQLASFNDVLIYLRSLQTQVFRLRTQTIEELDKLTRGETLKSQRYLTDGISSQASRPLHSPLQPPKEIQQAKNDVQKMMKDVEELVREWIILGECLRKDTEGKKQITKFVDENIMHT